MLGIWKSVVSAAAAQSPPPSSYAANLLANVLQLFNYCNFFPVLRIEPKTFTTLVISEIRSHKTAQARLEQKAGTTGMHPHQGDVPLLLSVGHWPPGCAGLLLLIRLLLLRLLQLSAPPIPVVHILDTQEEGPVSVTPNAETLSLHLLPTIHAQDPSPITPHPLLPKPYQLEGVGPGRTEPLLPGALPTLQLHPHGVQQPLPIGDLMGPHDVKEGRAQGVE